MARTRIAVPEKLPGRFFVLLWDRDQEQFVLYLDNPERDSYKLGGNIPAISVIFKVRGIEALGNRAIDMAREFGKVQVIPDKDRVIPLFDRSAKYRNQLQFHDGEISNAGCNLPDL